MPQIFNPILDRTVGQIRFRPTLDSFHQIAEVLHQFENRFEDWEAKKPENIVLYDKTEKKYLNLSFDSITYLTEKVSNTPELKELIGSVYRNQVMPSDINVIRRVSFRKTVLFSTQFEFSEIVDLIYRKFYSADEHLLSIASNESARDVVFVLDGKKNDLLNHVMIGPVTKTEGIQRFNNSFDIDETTVPNNCLLLDLDVFQDESNLTKSTAVDKFNACINELNRILDSYVTYLSE